MSKKECELGRTFQKGLEMKKGAGKCLRNESAGGV
jgi:hypothetical protein